MSQPTQHTILIVDDEPTNLTVLNAILNKHYRVKVALNGNDAIKLAQASPPPDLILLDVIMDPPDGFDVCTILKSDPYTQSIPIIFVTALNDSNNDKKAFQLGASDIFNKPYSASLILKRVENHLKLISCANIEHPSVCETKSL
jgi:PleD family two-component response regulator